MIARSIVTVIDRTPAVEPIFEQVFWSAAGVKPKLQTRQVDAGPWPSQLAIGATQAVPYRVSVFPVIQVMH